MGAYSWNLAVPIDLGANGAKSHINTTKTPDHSSTDQIQSEDARMAYKPRPGEVCLFENEKAGHDTAPDHRGYFIADRDIKAGEKVEFALWAGRADSPRSFGGRLSAQKISPEPPPLDLFGNPVETSE